MYSYEERMRAVELYIKLGKRARATICQLGYPSKNALKGWCREYECRQDLRSGFAPRPPKFSEAQKQIALQHFAAHGRCISWTMRALVSRETVQLPGVMRHAEKAVKARTAK